MEEKIVQISACGFDETSQTQAEHGVYALTNKGNIFFKDNRAGKYIQLPTLHEDNIV